MAVCRLPGELQNVCLGHSRSQAQLHPVFRLLREDYARNLRLYVLHSVCRLCLSSITLVRPTQAV